MLANLAAMWFGGIERAKRRKTNRREESHFGMNFTFFKLAVQSSLQQETFFLVFMRNWWKSEFSPPSFERNKEICLIKDDSTKRCVVVCAKLSRRSDVLKDKVETVKKT